MSAPMPSGKYKSIKDKPWSERKRVYLPDTIETVPIIDAPDGIPISDTEYRGYWYYESVIKPMSDNLISVEKAKHLFYQPMNFSGDHKK